MASLTFYEMSGSCSFGAHALLEELQIPYKSVKMHIPPELNVPAPVDGSFTVEEYRKIHHDGLIPALALNDAGNNVITQMPAILTYIGSHASPDLHILGKGLLERAKVLELLNYVSGKLHGLGYLLVFRPQRFTAFENQHEDVQNRGRKIVEAGYKRLDEVLEGREFLVGEQETVIDYYVTIFWRWGLECDFDMSGYKNYARLVRHMIGKESVKRTLKMAGKEFTV